jgi:hypothetical protein
MNSPATHHLEDELTAGLHERAAGVHLTRDVLGAARSRHRRRTTVARAATATGGVGLAGAVAAGVALSGTVTAGPSAPAVTTPAVVLDAATVSARISRALTDVGTKVMHIRMGITVGGESSRNELWRDPVSGAMRATGPKVPGNPRIDIAVERDGDLQTTTTVDHDRRVWYRDTFDLSTIPDRGEGGDKRSGPLSDFSPDGLRTSLARGEWTLVGRERLDGRQTLHLRVTDVEAGGEYDIWVDAGSYVLVRRVVTQPDDPPLHLVEDYEYLPRTGAVLAELKMRAVPRGYKQLERPPADTSPAPPGGRG